jgi:hypothetical protein
MSTHFRSEAIHWPANSSWFATDEGIMSGPSCFAFAGGSSPYRRRPFIRHVRHIGVSLTQQANVGRSGRVPSIVSQKANR